MVQLMAPHVLGFYGSRAALHESGFAAAVRTRIPHEYGEQLLWDRYDGVLLFEGAIKALASKALKHHEAAVEALVSMQKAMKA